MITKKPNTEFQNDNVKLSSMKWYNNTYFTNCRQALPTLYPVLALLSIKSALYL